MYDDTPAQTMPASPEDQRMEQQLQEAYEQSSNRIEQLQYELRVQTRVHAAAGAALKTLSQDEGATAANNLGGIRG